MASVKLSHVYKVYPNGLKAVNDFSIDIEDKEFIVFVGPSGCGKSTTLRMIAGLEDITAGELAIGGEVVNFVEAKDRDIAMVFQNYALYPHMSVYDNMAFALKIRKMNKQEIDRRVNEAAEILGITDYLKKKPKEMSGGQRQRVALGRAIVREPKVFLLDEPLSNLDAKLRTQMRVEISKLHQKLQTTFIYVTHDQVEAMTMGTRIVVMKDGFVQQIDTPRNLYSYPCNKFVAGFIGTPQMNFFKARLQREEGGVRIKVENSSVDVVAPASIFAKTDKSYLDGSKLVFLGIRAEHISLNSDAYGFKAKCRVSYVEDLGGESQVYADFNLEESETALESETKFSAKGPVGLRFGQGEITEVSLDLNNIHLFDAETGDTITPRIPSFQIYDCAVSGGTLSLLGAKFKLPPAMATEDGEYSIKIPTRAITPNGKIKAKFVGEEDVNGIRLAEVNCCGNAVFLAVSEEKNIFDGISVDLKHCDLIKGGETVVAGLPYENRLDGKIEKYKVKLPVEKNGKSALQSSKKYNFKVADSEVDYPEGLALKILEAGGPKIFKYVFELRFSLDACFVSDGIKAVVENIYDYGDEKYARCKVGENSVICLVPNDFSSNELSINFCWNDIAVYDKEVDVRII